MEMKAIEINALTPLIQVFNMPRALEFYRGILGFEVIADSGDGDDSSWVWLRNNGCDLMLNDQYEPGRLPDAPPAERVIWHGDTCLYFGGAVWHETVVSLRSGRVQNLFSMAGGN
mgnify:CR=1 FL=1